jgi:3D (Asp-Asp-Asp) domain-containing protein
MTVSIRRAQPITVKIGETTISGMSASLTVGEALQDAGVPLQNLDISLPPDDASLPENREIEVVRVREDVMVMTDEVAYENEYVEDPNTLLDQVSVIQPGQVGIVASRERVRYENGEAVERLAQDSWQASEARDGVLGYGTKVEIRTEVVDGITIEYWRKKTVYATSYEPCDNQGNCWDGTAGGYPLQMGIVAVTPQWYSVPNGLAMADLPVYVPGYGRAIIGDVGGGIPGTPWIDLAYRPEDNFTWDAHWTTMYFLTPVPDTYPAIIVP